MTSVRVGSRPIRITTSEGTIVTRRRIQTGMCRCRKPCMMTCPAMVPTEDEDSPEASSEMAKTQLAAEPSSGCRVRWASSMVPTSGQPVLWKVAAAMISMAALTRPATPMAITRR